MSSAFFDDATLARGVTGAKTTKKNKATKADAKPQETPPAQPVARIADEKLAEGVAKYREFVTTKIEPIARAVKTYSTPAAGRVCVSPFGLYVAGEDVAKYRAAIRDIGYFRGEYRRTHLVECFAATLIDNALDEAAALVASCLNFHDDRGDGLLYVPAFKAKATREAWERAAAALGIATKCRPCAR